LINSNKQITTPKSMSTSGQQSIEAGTNLPQTPAQLQQPKPEEIHHTYFQNVCNRFDGREHEDFNHALFEMWLLNGATQGLKPSSYGFSSANHSRATTPHHDHQQEHQTERDGIHEHQQENEQKKEAAGQSILEEKKAGHVADAK
jgi:hypothetical protein